MFCIAGLARCALINRHISTHMAFCLQHTPFHTTKAMVKCAVIGNGMMGCRIAAELALAGHEVWLNGLVNLASSKSMIAKMIQELITDGKLEEAALEIVESNIVYSTVLKDCLAGADFVSEVIHESKRAKFLLFEEMDPLCSPNAILSSNTMSLSISELAEAVPGREEFIIGVRFLYPVLLIDEIEVCLGEHTSKTTSERAKSFFAAMGKEVKYKMPGNDTFRRLDPSIHEIKQSEGAESRRVRLQEQETVERRRLGRLGSHQHGEAAEEDDDDMDTACCAICLTNPKDCVCMPCMHVAMCVSCATELKKSNPRCPMCRNPVSEIKKIFL
eukprot:m.16486 g.16486  ORF g.16486 m.16486 type:complete len:330 (+) comp7092_c0_seq2:158-1147(+)